MLGADRDAHELIGDPGQRELRVGELTVRRRLRVTRERLDPAEAHGIARDLEAPEELERAALAALDFDREDRARKVALRVADPLLLRVVEQRRVVHAQHARVIGEPLGDALGILALAVHPERDGREPRVEDPGLVRLQDVAE